jgi:hypothetical protein
MPERWINWELMMNPANWVVVFLMLAIGVMLMTVIHSSWVGSK